MVEDILSQVNKPGRYIGNEWNSPKKDFGRAGLKFALCFPDLYEIGMSNLGLRIIYGMINNLPGVACERFFSPASDMEKVLQDNNMEIFSLESKRPLREFDIVGFSLSYELCYTNVLSMLAQGRIPLQASIRDCSYPLVIGGGPCVMNPEPMHEFFDLFVIGEAEDVLLEVLDAYGKLKDKFKNSQISKRDLLVILSGIEGVYVPSLYEVVYEPSGKIKEFKPSQDGLPVKIKKRFVKDLDKAYFPLEWLVPYIEIVHDRITLEIMRGCPNRCSFCQARSQYFPFRQRNADNVLNLAFSTYKNTGYEDISLCGLSVSDYSGMEGLLKTLVDYFKEKAVSVSLPSIKPKVMVGELSSLIATIKKTGLTFAPEAATEKLRKVLNKDFDTEEFFHAIERAYLSGYQHIKLYFMIGLPSEEDTDLDGIIDFANSVSRARAKVGKPPAQVNLSVNTLIPKPHTSFQWLKMQDFEGIKYKQDYLKKKINNRRLKISFHNRSTSILEGVLSRGDRRLSRVILAAFNKGARFDAWDSHFVFERWQDAFNECGVDYNYYLGEKSRDEILPWDFLDVGISKEALRAEFDKSIDI